MVDFVNGLLHGLAFAFLVYGAFLATAWALEGRPEPRLERRRQTRRKADRRRELRQDFYGVPM
jgi:hypothetical protein